MYGVFHMAPMRGGGGGGGEKPWMVAWGREEWHIWEKDIVGEGFGLWRTTWLESQRCSIYLANFA